MNIFLKSSLIFSLLVSAMATPFTIDNDSFKSPFAIAIYSAILAHVGIRVADKLSESSFYKLRKITNFLTPEELRLEAMYREKLLEIKQAEFNFNATQKQLLEANYPRYKKNLLRKKKEIADSTKPQEEKDVEIQEIDKRLALIKQQKNEKSDSLFEQMLQQAGVLK